MCYPHLCLLELSWCQYPIYYRLFLHGLVAFLITLTVHLDCVSVPLLTETNSLIVQCRSSLLVFLRGDTYGTCYRDPYWVQYSTYVFFFFFYCRAFIKQGTSLPLSRSSNRQLSFTSNMVWGTICLISKKYVKTHICFIMKPVLCLQTLYSLKF